MSREDRYEEAATRAAFDFADGKHERDNPYPAGCLEHGAWAATMRHEAATVATLADPVVGAWPWR